MRTRMAVADAVADALGKGGDAAARVQGTATEETLCMLAVAKELRSRAAVLGGSRAGPSAVPYSRAAELVEALMPLDVGFPAGELRLLSGELRMMDAIERRTDEVSSRAAMVLRKLNSYVPQHAETAEVLRRLENPAAEVWPCGSGEDPLAALRGLESAAAAMALQPRVAGMLGVEPNAFSRLRASCRAAAAEIRQTVTTFGEIAQAVSGSYGDPEISEAVRGLRELIGRMQEEIREIECRGPGAFSLGDGMAPAAATESEEPRAAPAR